MRARIARINLSNSQVDIYETNEFYHWLGGRGYGVKVLLDELSQDVDPISEGNKLIFSVGSLTGTLAPASARTEIITKNVLTTGISYSSGGGQFGPVLRAAGFECLIIEGKAAFPVYVFIDGGKVEIKDARILWGKSTWETEDALRDQHKDDAIEVASIGIAGENQVRFSCIMTAKAHAFAWGGSGAVMGFKNLKAIAVRGHEEVKIYDSKQFTVEAKRYKWALLASEPSHLLRLGGTHGMAGVGGFTGKAGTAVRNIQEEWWDEEKKKKVNEKAFQEFEKRRTTCYNCPLYCLHEYRMEKDFEVLDCEGVHANSVRGFSSNWDVDDPFYVLKAHALCNKHGLNVDEVSAVIAWAIECYQRGIITTEDTNGMKLEWGDGETLVKLTEDIAHLKGFGKFLAQGVSQAAEKLGRDSMQYAMHIKGAGFNEQNIRSHKAWSLGMAVSLRGGGHLGGSPLVEVLQIPENTGRWLFNEEKAGLPAHYEGKGRIVAWYEIYKALVDSIGICYFCSGWYNFSLADPEYMTALFNAMTGEHITSQELWEKGWRIVNNEKAFNVLHGGFSRENDRLPDRIYDQPLTEGPHKGAYIDRTKYSEMLSEYYTALGWDQDTGIPKKDTLQSLDQEELLKILMQ